jgi:hypothetical protein
MLDKLRLSDVAVAGKRVFMRCGSAVATSNPTPHPPAGSLPLPSHVAFLLYCHGDGSPVSAPPPPPRRTQRGLQRAPRRGRADHEPRAGGGGAAEHPRRTRARGRVGGAGVASGASRRHAAGAWARAPLLGYPAGAFCRTSPPSLFYFILILILIILIFIFIFIFKTDVG